MRPKAPLVIAILAAALVVVAGVVLAVVQPWQVAPVTPAATGTTDQVGPAAPPAVLDATTYVLDDAGPDAPVVVEFLDFECEACGAVYPTMEELREQYDGEVTFAIRYFPLPGHFNSRNAAHAAEAAAQQGQLEAMYSMLFETQAEWGEAQTSEAERFRGYAEQLGLDMAAYDTAVVSEETAARVELDFQAGVALGVQSTPTIFIDGEALDLVRITDIEAGIETALAER